ncbi:MAG TPA: uracil-DNA glycosylase [Planctomycetota bacterium]
MEARSAAPSDDPRAEVARLARALSEHLERQVAAGIERAAVSAAPAPVPGAAQEPPVLAHPVPAPAAPRAAAPAPRPAAAHELLGVLTPSAAPAGAPPEAPEVAGIRLRARACAGLPELRELVAGCTACELARTRTQTVFCDGPAGARVMFVGEAPGQHEDERGVPFVGAAGQLLTDIIQKGMGLRRAEVHIANVLKCRPPDNREPAPEEKARCTPYLDRQIELVDPEVLIALGLHAARHLLRSTLSMGRLRGKVHLLEGRKVVATYHPAYLLRNPAAKKDCWQDIQLAMRALGLEPPPAPSRPAPA